MRGFDGSPTAFSLGLPIKLWRLLLSATIGLTLVVGARRGIPPIWFGALSVLWSGLSAWSCGLIWTACFWAVGLTLCIAWPVRLIDGIAEAPVVIVAMIASAFWMHSLRSRLDHESQSARLDALTGLPNRQAFVERCEAELNRALRFQRPLTLMLLDGDRFKEVNDQRGHAVGDSALEAAAHTLRDGTRQYDFVARLGGDEFVILLPETAAGDAEKVAQRLQAALAAGVTAAFPPLTFSIGVATFGPGRWNVADCLAEADRLLYSAKQAGRGRFCAESLEEQPPH